ncbi:MAG TPA: IclR family transcriptional regulator [Iamia sp.]|nr:IclR family transcriptional regulator [Iamia sp.]
MQGIERAASVLRAVGGGGGGLKLAEVVAAVGLPKTTVHRVIGALEAEGLLRVDIGGRIWLGPALRELARVAATDLAAQVRPAVAALHRATDETVDVAVVDGTAVRFIDQIQSTRALRAVSEVGATFPLHATANGKAALAAMTPAEVDAVLARGLTALTRNTHVDPERLRAELADVVDAGVAFDHQEHTLGISAVGAAVVGPRGPILTLSIPTPTERFAASRDHLVGALRVAVAQAEDLLG